MIIVLRRSNISGYYAHYYVTRNLENESLKEPRHEEFKIMMMSTAIGVVLGVLRSTRSIICRMTDRHNLHSSCSTHETTRGFSYHSGTQLYTLLYFSTLAL